MYVMWLSCALFFLSFQTMTTQKLITGRFLEETCRVWFHWIGSTSFKGSKMDRGRADAPSGHRGYSFIRSSTPDYSRNTKQPADAADSIPDVPENQEVRDFLKNAPKTGLHMPLGKEVKTMQCWRCKGYGHRWVGFFGCIVLTFVAFSELVIESVQWGMEISN